MIPKVLLCYHSRPMSLGIMLREAFRQAGCAVMVAGPGTAEVYDRTIGPGDFDPEDYVAPDWELPNFEVDVGELLAKLPAPPDLLVWVDQYDPFCLRGTVPPEQKFACVQVENWGDFYAARYAGLTTSPESSAWYYMICHTQTIPFPREDYKWLPFGFDPQMHRYLPGTARDKMVCQIGSPYDPRPAVWNHLRAAFDAAPELGNPQYAAALQETEHTLFGRSPSHWSHVIAYNRARVAISSSNCDFAPMRVCEAYGMGCVLTSDDVPAVRAVLGPPQAEGGFWVAHDRTPEGIKGAVQEASMRYSELIDRGMAAVYRQHTYRHRAERILARAGLRGACRVV